MIVQQAPASFRPVTITLETQDELDMLVACLAAVSQNCINHTPQLIRAAKHLVTDLVSSLEEDS